MFGKVRISADLEIVTGLHIGGGNEFSAIGAIDSPVIRDSYNKEPIIPGSSLKGKIRTLLAQVYSDGIVLNKCNDDPVEIVRLFGGSEKKNIGGRNVIPQSRLQFSDCFLKNSDKLREDDIALTEVKFENSIDRITSKANPRQIERVVRGSIFDFSLVYTCNNEQELNEDMEIIYKGIKLLEMDYLGGSGSRGYGKVRFNDLKAEVIFGNIPENKIISINKIFNR